MKWNDKFGNASQCAQEALAAIEKEQAE